MFCRGDHKRLIKSLNGANYRLKKKENELERPGWAGNGEQWTTSAPTKKNL
jgi:uncharacterized protein YjhX (UPF0386 family)